MAKTKSGFEFKIDKDRLDDWELIERMANISDEDPKGYMTMMIDILGNDQYVALKEHLRTKEGRVRITSMRREMDEIFGDVDFAEVKN
ncbi:hypothetical protein [uncultured Dubosiella sp.]|uniref:hypothetical protein n=1 Tax=uncultured Dubosiella sp. TaxID=1937011 RepID=UPI0022CC324C|nr:hypothetical protein [uncultured Dubosiella sp.]MCZ2855904.1 hypothetical protein [Candidatus Bathyarchaeota archaeon]